MLNVMSGGERPLGADQWQSSSTSFSQLLVLSSVGGEIRQSNVLPRQTEKAGSCHMTLPRLSFSLAGMKEGDRKQLCNFFDYEDDTKKCCISCLDLIYVSVIKCWTVVL